MSTIKSIELHVRSYRSALKSNLEVTINSLKNTHIKTKSILHPLASNPKKIDIAALIYSLCRLPPQIDQTTKIIIGQRPEVFKNANFPDITKWPRVNSKSRRRTTHFNKNTKTLAVFAASISDIDDLVNLLIAYQIETNKLHLLLQQIPPKTTIPHHLNLSTTDWIRLKIALGEKWRHRLSHFKNQPTDLRLRLLAGSWNDYAKTTQKWWKNISSTTDPKIHMSHQNIYFVSSNTYSLLNIITGLPLKLKNKLLPFTPTLPSNNLHQNDILYYIFHLNQNKFKKQSQQIQDKLGFLSIPSAHYLDINTQIIPIKNLTKSKYLDPRLKIKKPKKLNQSTSLIFNIDYPLGFAAHLILNEILQNVAKVKGIYILGKAAVLNGELGDIQLPKVVFDEHSQNSYLFKNCFNTFFPFKNKQGSIISNQKAVSVLGTFLENQALIDKYSQNDFTIIEMESGPYLSAISQITYDQPTPKSTIVDLNPAPLDIGIINYTSDTPYSKAKNLGSGQLTLPLVEPIYLGSLTILQRIINLEESTPQ